MRRLGLALVAVLSGCAPEPDPPRRAAIVAGSLDHGHPAVVAIGSRRLGCVDRLSATCSGTLIAPRVVLTAAHCLDRSAVVLEVLIGESTAQGEHHRVIQQQTHRAFNPTTNEADLALLLLEEPASVAPAALFDGPLLPAAIGSTARMVGFGDTRSAEPAGIKRVGTGKIATVDAGTFRVDAAPGMSCRGDSGGPVLIDGPVGEVVAGVIASGDPGCNTFSLNVRVDLYRQDFIDPFIARGALPLPEPASPVAIDAVCEAGCITSADCPAALECLAMNEGRRCGRAGEEVGRYGETCADDSTCRCIRLSSVDAPDSCRCVTPCSQPQAGCDASHSPKRTGALAFLALMLFCAIVVRQQSKV